MPDSTELARAPRLINGPSRLSLAALAAAFASLLLAAPALAAPPNDDFADADVLPGAIPATAQGTTVSGTTVDATTEAGQPEAGEAVWYRWTPTVSQTVIFDLCGPGSGSGLQHKVNVYTGAALGSLTPQSPTGSPSSFPCASNAGSAADQESYAVTAGTTYQIAVQPYFFGTPRGFDLRLRTLPPNDNFANRATIAAGPLPISVTGYNVGATAEAGEPLHAGLTPRRTVWYSWTPTTSGFASIQTCGGTTETNLDTVIGVYTDTSPAPALTDLDPEASGDNGCTDSGLNRRSTVSIAYTALTTYYIAVGTKNTGFPDTEYGTFELRIVPPAAPANDNFANRQTLTRSNVGATPVAGTIAGATAEGGEPSHGPVAAHHSAWFRWTPGAGQGGVVAVDTCHTQTQFDAAAAVYTGGAVSGLTPVKKRNQNCGNSTGARVVFNATEGTPYAIAVDGADAGEAGAFGISIHRVPANDYFEDRIALPAGHTSVTEGTTEGGISEPLEPDHAGQPPNESVWYSWTPSSTGRVTIDTCGPSNYDLQLAVYTGASFSAPLTPVTSNDNACGDGDLGSKVSFVAQAGVEYSIAVDATLTPAPGSAAYSFDLAIAPTPANDAFADAQTLSGPLPLTVDGTNRGATEQTDEPDHVDQGFAWSVWYSWTPAAGNYSIDTCQDHHDIFTDTAVSVYTGTALTNLVEIQGNDDGNDAPGCDLGPFDSNESSQLNLNVPAAGTQSGSRWTMRPPPRAKAATSSSRIRSIGPRPANDDFANAEVIPSGNGTVPIQITGNTTGAGAQPGEQGADGFGELPDHPRTGVLQSLSGNSVWFQVDRADHRRVPPGQLRLRAPSYAPTVHTSFTATDRTGREWDCLAPNGLPSGVVVMFDATAGQEYWFAVDYRTEGPFTATLKLADPPNDDFANATPLVPGPGLFNGENFGASVEAGEPIHPAGNNGGRRSIWYRYTPTELVDATFSLCGLDDQFEQHEFPLPFAAIYTGAAVNALTRVTPTRANTDNCNVYRFRASPGTTYRIAVDGVAEDPLFLNLNGVSMGTAQISFTTTPAGSTPDPDPTPDPGPDTDARPHAGSHDLTRHRRPAQCRTRTTTRSPPQTRRRPAGPRSRRSPGRRRTTS